MSTNQKQTSTPQPTSQPPKILNEDVLKGVWVDGIGFFVGKDYVILEGVITAPRTNEPYVATRMLFPTRILGQLAETLRTAMEKQKEMEKAEEQKK
jgi:hypothetical protein